MGRCQWTADVGTWGKSVFGLGGRYLRFPRFCFSTVRLLPSTLFLDRLKVQTETEWVHCSKLVRVPRSMHFKDATS